MKYSLKTILIMLVPVLLLTASCHKGGDEEETVADGLVFGTYYGFCTKNCVKMFEVHNSTLAKDDSVKYADLTWNYKFKTSRLLDKASLTKANALLGQVPKRLFSGGAQTFGSPDSHDQGGLYIEIETISGNYKFKLDMDDTPDQPAEVIAFKKQVLGVLAQIK